MMKDDLSRPRHPNQKSWLSTVQVVQQRVDMHGLAYLRIGA